MQIRDLFGSSEEADGADLLPSSPTTSRATTYSDPLACTGSDTDSNPDPDSHSKSSTTSGSSATT